MKTKTHNNDSGGRTSFIMMNKFIISVFLWALFSIELFAEKLNLLNNEPVKIEYYGEEFSYPPIVIKLKKGSKLYKQLKTLLSKEDWCIGITFIGTVPNITVFGKDDAFSLGIGPYHSAILYKKNTGFFKATNRLRWTQDGTYLKVRATILDLIKKKKETGSSGADEVIIPPPKKPHSPRKPYSPKDLDEAYSNEMKPNDTIQLLDSKKSNIEKMKVIESILDRVKKNPTCPKSIKKEIEEKGEKFKQKELKIWIELNNKMTKKEREQVIEAIKFFRKK